MTDEAKRKQVNKIKGGKNNSALQREEETSGKNICTGQRKNENVNSAVEEKIWSVDFEYFTQSENWKIHLAEKHKDRVISP